MEAGGVLIALAALAASPAAAISPASSDAEVWAIARKVNSPAGYRLYLRRFPSGAHTAKANEAMALSLGQTLPLPPAPRVPIAPPMIVTPLKAIEVSSCAKALIARTTGGVSSPAIDAFEAARGTNRVEDFQQFLIKFPTALCREEAAAFLTMRAERKALFPQIAGFGPLMAQRRFSAIFTSDDYPPSALRNEERGRVTARFDVADDGTAESCRAEVSSGSVALDSATCRIILRRIRYDPARDSEGRPIRSSDAFSIAWTLPMETPVEAAPANGVPRP